MNIIEWFRRRKLRREYRKLEAAAAAAELIIQQRGMHWTNTRCTSCSNFIPFGANYCSICGLLIAKNTPIPPTQPQAPTNSHSHPFDTEPMTFSFGPHLLTADRPFPASIYTQALRNARKGMQ